MIWLTDNTRRVPLDRGKRSLWVYSDKWERPEAERAVPAAEFIEHPWSHYSAETTDTVIIVGMSTIVTPSNRVKTGPFLNEPWSGRRESIDRCLFVGEPWRAWWHWGCVGAKWHDAIAGDVVQHSFAMENRWNQYLDNRRPDPCSLESFKAIGKNIVITGSHTPRFGGMDIEVIPVMHLYGEEYLAEKEKAFEHMTTWRGIVKALSAFAQRVAPERRVPSVSQIFNALGKTRPSLVISDLPVDRWISSHLRYLVDLTDGIAEAFQQEDAWIR